VESFFDGMIPAQLRAHHVAGAAVAVVREGRVLLSKGYGYSHVAKRRRVQADRTLFRIASITKLFVWAAVMQLVENGRLDLDQDVNTHLARVHVPDTYPESITMRHLMSHSPGFEDEVIGLFARDASALRPLDETLEARMPARIFPPGRIPAYSNYGAALAARVVERVAGQPWEGYVDEHVLEPLGMHDTTMRQPPPPALWARVSKGYAYLDGRYRSRPFEYVTLAPAGGASATADDMTKFMIANLQGGRGVLEAGTVARMQEPLLTSDPRMGRMLHGLYEMRRTPVRAIGHGGDAFAFHSLLMLLPDHRVGLFVSYNGEYGAEARRALIQAFLQRYFPPSVAPLSAVPDGADARVREVAGTYLSTRRPADSPVALSAVVRAVRIRTASGGRIVVHGPFPGPIWMVEQEPYLFRETLGDRTLVFRAEGPTGRAILHFDHAPMVAFERARWFETRTFQLAAVGVPLSVFGSFLIGMTWRAWRQRRESRKAAPSSAPRLASRAEVLARACTTAFCASFLLQSAAFVQALRHHHELAFGLPAVLGIALALPVLALPAWLGAAGLGVLAWKRSFWSWPDRVHQTSTVVAGGLFMAWLWYWNLLGG